MSSIHPGVTGRRPDDQFEPLAVSPREACVLLNIGNTRLYELIGKGDLDSYKDGASRKITMESIRRRVARKLDAARAAGEDTKSHRRRGRPRKVSAGVQQRLDELTGARSQKAAP
jgi:excisionase family DNA binding protein